MRRHRNHSIAFKRPVAQAFLDREILHGLAKQHDISRNLIRLWVRKYEAGEFDGKAAVAGLGARAGLNDPDGEHVSTLASHHESGDEDEDEEDEEADEDGGSGCY